MTTDHEQRLTLVNKKLVLELNHAGQMIARMQKFIRRLTDAEDLGHAVSGEVRTKAADLLLPDPTNPDYQPGEPR